MLLQYSDYEFTATLDSSGSGEAFSEPSDGSALFDGRTGVVQGFVWPSGAQSTSTYIEIQVHISSDIDATPAHGAIGLCNVIGLPENTRCVLAGIEQRLVADSTGELNAWALPFATGATAIIRIYNDQGGGVHSITAGQEFAIGEISVGRLISLKTQMYGQPSSTPVDPTAKTRTEDGQNWEVMRKPHWQEQQRLGLFTAQQARGGSSSDLPSGIAGQTIDIRRLMMMLATTRLCGVCMMAHADIGDETTTNGIKFNKDFMQSNWMLARPFNLNSLVLSAPPRWTWNPGFEQAN